MRAFFGGIILVFCFFATGCGHRTYKVPTGAMQPTIKIGSYAIADEEVYKSKKPIERFDIVVHKAPLDENTIKQGTDQKTRFVFRIIGLGGERIEIKKGQVFINDKLLNETFEKIPSSDNFGPFMIPGNEFFLLGDNRPESNDSRYWKQTTVKREDIFGKIVEIY